MNLEEVAKLKFGDWIKHFSGNLWEIIALKKNDHGRFYAEIARGQYLSVATEYDLTHFFSLEREE